MCIVCFLFILFKNFIYKQINKATFILVGLGQWIFHKYMLDWLILKWKLQIKENHFPTVNKNLYSCK